MAGLALVSVQWARGRWLPRRWLPRAGLAATALGVLLVPFGVGAMSSGWGAGAGDVDTYEAGYQPVPTCADGGGRREPGAVTDRTPDPRASGT